MVNLKSGPKKIPVEIRKDPLLQVSSRICHFKDNLQFDVPDLRQMGKETEKICPFCAGRVLDITPTFPPEIVPQGRLGFKDMHLFPNLSPYDTISGVLTLGDQHYVSMRDLHIDGGKRIAKAFGVATEFFGVLQNIKHPESVYNLLAWNYMPLSGGSIIHPHMQVVASAHAPTGTAASIAASKVYFQANQRNFWDDLCDVEQKDGSRYLGTIGSTRWFMSFAPTGMIGDVIGVAGDSETLLDASPQQLRDLALGIARAIAAYETIGVWSFNVTVHGGPVSGDPATRLHVVFTPRVQLSNNGTVDISAWQIGYSERFSIEFPEKLQKMVKPFFAAAGK